MIISFANTGTEDIFDGTDSREARQTCPRELWQKSRDKLTVMNAVSRLEMLKVPPGNRLELLKGDRKGQHSIRINQQYRICFWWTEKGPAEVEIVDYH
jgi:proteic killer suppression protein